MERGGGAALEHACPGTVLVADGGGGERAAGRRSRRRDGGAARRPVARSRPRDRRDERQAGIGLVAQLEREELPAGMRCAAHVSEERGAPAVGGAGRVPREQRPLSW